MALHGGEDYELLFTAPASRKIPASVEGAAVSEIGRVRVAKPGQARIELLTESGAEPLAPSGWEHFSASN